jgi:hypothetical protein
MSDSTPEELAQAVSKPGVFSFTERLKGRNYPQETVIICLDERAGYEIYKLEQKLSRLTDKEGVKAAEAEIARLREVVKAEIYTVHMEGISPEDYDALVDQAVAQFPYEYNEVENPFTGAKIQEVVTNDARDEYFRKLKWNAFIRKIEDHDGNINIPDFETIDAFTKQAPLMAQSAVLDAVDKLRMATDWMNYIQDEDFLVKP